MTGAQIQPVIMSGGSGTRLWPLSRTGRPKQFLPLVSSRSLFQETVLRFAEDEIFLPPLIVCGAQHAHLVREQLHAIGIEPAGVLLEPLARNTASVAAVAAHWGRERRADALILLSPADHHVSKPDVFRRAIVSARAAARDGRIVTFGIHAETPHTGYGYVERGARLYDDVFEAVSFREKPNAENAVRLVQAGRFDWNAGVFLFSAQALLEELSSHAPEIARCASAALKQGALSEDGFILDRAALDLCPSISIDYAVMEKTRRAAICGPLDIGWSDVGSWISTPASTDAEQRLALQSRDCILHTDGPLIAALGVENLIIIATRDAVLVAHKDRAEEVKTIVEALKAAGRTDLL